jgi:MFS family permease
VKPETGNSALAAFRHRDFSIFWGGLVVSAIGTQFTTVAMAWQVYELTNSALQLGLIGLARAVPQMGLMLFGGLLADAIDRRRLMMITQLPQVVVPALLVALTVAGAITPLWLYVGTVCLALCSSIENPARQAIVPNLVPRSHLTSALALNSTQRNVAQILGPSLAGLVLGATGAGPCYAVDAVSRIAMVAALALLRFQPRAEARSAISLQSLREGVSFLWHHPVILSLTVLDFAQNLLGAPRAVLPIYARDILSVGPEGLGLLYSANAIGSIVVAGGMSIFGNVRRPGLWVILGVTTFSISTALFAVSQIFWFSVLMLAVEGAGNTVSAVLRGTMLQLATPDELRGRVTSVNSIFTNGGPQLGQFRAGAVAELVGAEWSTLGGALALMLVVAGVATVQSVRNYEIVEAPVRRRPTPGGEPVVSGR